MKNKNICPWGKKVWEEKIKTQDERGTIHGGRFSKSKEITERTKEEAMEYLDKQVFPKIKKNGKIMDAGVGALARFSIEFAKKGYKVLGIDISPTILAYAKKHIEKQDIKGIRLIQDDLTKLNNIKKRFDFIFCFGTFGHIPKILALETLRNFHSKLNKGGFCFVHFWIEKDPSLKEKFKDFIYFQLHKIREKSSKSFCVNCSFYSKEELKELLKYSKFHFVSERKEGFFLLEKEKNK